MDINREKLEIMAFKLPLDVKEKLFILASREYTTASHLVRKLAIEFVKSREKELTEN
jgi:hypothetical protein